jgi:hypothetical protein
MEISGSNAENAFPGPAGARLPPRPSSRRRTKLPANKGGMIFFEDF